MLTKEKLLETMIKIQRELDAVEEVLNDGIDYGDDFVEELHAHTKEVMLKSVRAKGILVKRYGIVAI